MQFDKVNNKERLCWPAVGLGQRSLGERCGCVVLRCSHGTLMRELSHGWADGVLVLPRSILISAVLRMCGCDDQRCSLWHSQARADPWMSGWGVSVSPRYSQARAGPWMSGQSVSVSPRYSQVRAFPRMSGCGVERYSHGTLEWEPTHGWAVVTRVVPIAASSKSCDFVVFALPPLFLWDLHLMLWPLSPAGFTVFFFFCLVLFMFTGIHPSPLLFSVTGAIRLPLWGLMAGISGLPATGRLPALEHSTQLPYAM